MYSIEGRTEPGIVKASLYDILSNPEKVININLDHSISHNDKIKQAKKCGQCLQESSILMAQER